MNLRQWVRDRTPEEALAVLDRSQHLRPDDPIIDELLLDAPHEIRAAAIRELVEGVAEHKAALRILLVQLIEDRQRRADECRVSGEAMRSLRNELRARQKQLSPDLEPLLASAREGVRDAMRAELSALARENSDLKSKLAELTTSKRRLREALEREREREASKRART